MPIYLLIFKISFATKLCKKQASKILEVSSNKISDNNNSNKSNSKSQNKKQTNQSIKK